MNKATNVKKQILASQIAYKRTQNNEVQLERALAKFFNKLKKEVLNALDEYWKDYQMLQGHIDLITAPVHEAHKEYYELLTLYIKREYRLGSAEAKRLVRLANSKQRVASKSMRMPVRAIIKKDNDLFGTLPSAEERLLNRTFTASERTLSRVDSQINQIITDGYRSGKGINDVANSLNQRFDQLTSWESKRIARTEIHNSHNTAVMDTYKELDVEYTMWIAAEDERTRDSHLEINGEIIPMGGTYSNGLAYPGDTSGDIEEWINCRCSNAPFVVPYGFMAPSFSPFREDDLIKVDNKPNPLVNESESPIPSEVEDRMVKSFGQRYANSSTEHMQFFSSNSETEVAHGHRGEVRRTGQQNRFLKEKAKSGEEVHSVHNHPTDAARKEGYTMFSNADVDIFIEDNIKGYPMKSTEYGVEYVPINMRTSSAENQFNKITIERLDNFEKAYNKGLKPGEMLGKGTGSAVNRAFRYQSDFYDYYHPTVTPGMEYKRTVKQALREKGLSTHEINAEMKKVESKAQKLDEALFKERQREFPNLIAKMNEELEPYGLKISSKYKVEGYGELKPNTTPKWIKEMNPKVVQQESKLTAEEMNRMDWLKEQVEMGKSDLKKLPKDNPQYDSIKKMVENNERELEKLKKKMK